MVSPGRVLCTISSLLLATIGLFVGPEGCAPSEVEPHPMATPAIFTPAEEAIFSMKRMQMVKEQIRAREITDERVLAAMEKVPRHKFVLSQYLGDSYADHPLPIGEGQTISQPYVVALMTELLELKRGDKVLEIGTGSGYQAAVLAELTEAVYSIEIIDILAQRASARLDQLGYFGVKTKVGDGYYGWEEHAPYDAIIVTAAPDHIPRPLIDQLKDGGRMVIPVGPPGGYQTLWKIAKRGDEVKSTNMGGVLFVPLLGQR